MRLRVTTNRYFPSISDFTFIKEIGVGSFGTVQLALHLQTNKCYAVKVVHIEAGVGDHELLLLEREINLHTGVDHPHIIKLWDTLIEEGTVYMIMELAENGTLFSYQTKNRKIGQPEAFKFFSQALSAVRYMHAHDIMHRDIKPENILLDNAFNVKICDLGWATDNIHMKRRTFCGTYEYMAPEMVFQKEYNYAVDIWALGVLLYELVHGSAPFPAKSLEQMKEKVKLGFYELGSGFSKELTNLIVQILQFDFQERPNFSQIVAHPWMERIRREIRGEIGKVQSQLQGDVSTRAKVQREKGSMPKKHNRFDSLMNDPNFFKKIAGHQLPTAMERLILDGCGKAKKKCKTQGQQIIEKMLTESVKTAISRSKPLKRQKQNNSQAKLTGDNSKTLFPFKNESPFTTLKMKRIAEKLSEITSKCPLEGRKKGRIKIQRESGC